eukprot:1196258-Prorocentrum_minimum.AAC.3
MLSPILTVRLPEILTNCLRSSGSSTTSSSSTTFSNSTARPNLTPFSNARSCRCPTPGTVRSASTSTATQRRAAASHDSQRNDAATQRRSDAAGDATQRRSDAATQRRSDAAGDATLRCCNAAPRGEPARPLGANLKMLRMLHVKDYAVEVQGLSCRGLAYPVAIERADHLQPPPPVGADFALQVAHPGVGLALRVDHQRPAAALGHKDGVLRGHHVRRQPRQLPLAHLPGARGGETAFRNRPSRAHDRKNV